MHLSVQTNTKLDIDGLAKDELKWLLDINDTQVLPGQCWRIKNNDNGEYIQGDIESSLRSVMYEKEMKTTWTKKSN